MIKQVGQNVNYRWIWVTYRGFSVLLFLQLFCKCKVLFKIFLKYWSLCQLLKGIQLHQAHLNVLSQKARWIAGRFCITSRQPVMDNSPGLTSNRTASPGDPLTTKPSCLVPLSSWYLLPFIIASMVQFSSVQFSSCPTLRPHESQLARPPCPSPSPGVHSDSHPSSQWCHPAISSSVVPFSSCPQFLPASESFPMSQLFAWGGQSTGVSALTSVLPKKSQGWSPSEWTGWISLQSKGLSRVFSNTTVQKH